MEIENLRRSCKKSTKPCEPADRNTSGRALKEAAREN